MEINTTNIHEIRVRGKEIYFQYKTEKDAFDAYWKQWSKICENINCNVF